MTNLPRPARRFEAGLCLALACSLGCASATPAARAPGTRPAAPTTAKSSGDSAAPGRTSWLTLFARAYFPGRSGQIFLVPRKGDVITDRDPMYGFMHGSPWDYDAHIPLLLHGRPFVRAGTFQEPATQQDVAPTLSRVMGAMPAATMTGRVLSEALTGTSTRPRVVVLLVFDGMRADYFDRYAEVMPTLARLRREGAWFANARVNYLPTLTSVGHATIGTGTDPRIHGLAANNLFNRVTGRPQPAYARLNPGEMMALTLADVWNLTTDGRAIIAGQGGAIRATAGLLGHGACLVNARPVIAASYETRSGGWETNPDCYRLPDYLSGLNGRDVWTEAGGRWMDHDISNGAAFRASSLFQRFEGDAVAKVAEEEAFGADAITDLLMVNMKGPDYVGHAYGPDAPEMREAMAELDRQTTRLLEIIDRKAGPDGRLLAITADHGMPAEPPAGRRHYIEEIAARINERFDPGQRKIVTYYGDAANNQIYLDTGRLETLGVSLRDVARFLEQQPFIVAAFTEDEVRSAAGTLR